MGKKERKSRLLNKFRKNSSMGKERRKNSFIGLKRMGKTTFFNIIIFFFGFLKHRLGR